MPISSTLIAKLSLGEHVRTIDCLTKGHKYPDWISHIPKFSDEDYRNENLQHDINTVIEVMQGFPCDWAPPVCEWTSSDAAQNIVKTFGPIVAACNYGAHARMIPKGQPGNEMVHCMAALCEAIMMSWVGKMLGLEALNFKRVSGRLALVRTITDTASFDHSAMSRNTACWCSRCSGHPIRTRSRSSAR